MANLLTQENIPDIFTGKRYRLTFDAYIGEEGGLGEELIVNGGFDGNADGWGLPEGVTYNDNNILVTPGSDNIYNDPSYGTITEGKTYRISFTIGGTTGNVGWGCYPILNDWWSPDIISFGTEYSVDLIALSSGILDGGDNPNYFVIGTGDGFDGTIDNVSVREVLPSGNLIVYQGTQEIFRTLLSINVYDDIEIGDEEVDTFCGYLSEVNDSINVSENNTVTEV